MGYRLTAPFDHPAFSFESKEQFHLEFSKAVELLKNKPEGSKIKLNLNQDLKKNDPFQSDKDCFIQYAFKHEYLKINGQVVAISTHPHNKYIGKGYSCRVKWALGCNAETDENILYALKIEIPRLSHIFENVFSSDGSFESAESSLLWENDLWPAGGHKILRQTNHHGNRRYTLMYYQGETLDTFLESQTLDQHSLSEDAALDIAIKIFISLHRLHTGRLKSGRLFAHLDLKPSNISISIDPTGEIKLSLIDYEFSRAYELTQSSDLPFRGSPLYLPFEGPYEQGQIPKAYYNHVKKTMNTLTPPKVDLFAALEICYGSKKTGSTLPANSLFTEKMFEKLPEPLQNFLQPQISFNKKIQEIKNPNFSALLIAAVLIMYKEHKNAELLGAYIDSCALDTAITDLKHSVSDQKEWVGRYDPTFDQKVFDLQQPTNTVDDKPNTAGFTLHTAMQKEKVDSIKERVFAGANVNKLFKTGSSCLINAVMGKKLASVQTLLKHAPNVDIHFQNGSGRTALWFASILKLNEFVDVLLNYQPKGFTYSGSGDLEDLFGITPLSAALIVKEQKIALTLIKHGASFTKKNAYGFSPLILAVLLGHEEVLKLMLDTTRKWESLVTTPNAETLNTETLSTDTLHHLVYYIKDKEKESLNTYRRTHLGKVARTITLLDLAILMKHEHLLPLLEDDNFQTKPSFHDQEKMNIKRLNT